MKIDKIKKYIPIIIVLAIGILLGLIFAKNNKLVSQNEPKDRIEIEDQKVVLPSEEMSWLKLKDHGLGIEIEYPSTFTVDREGSDDWKALRVSRPVGYGERMYCNESGMPKPHILADLEMQIEVVDKGWDEYAEEIKDKYNIHPDDWENFYQKKFFTNGREYYVNISGVEQCNYSTTYLPVDNEHVVVITEPSYAPEDQKMLEEMRAGKPPVSTITRERILTSIRVLNYQQ